MNRVTDITGRILKAELRYHPAELPIEVAKLMELTGGRPLTIDVKLKNGGRINLMLMKTPHVHEMNGQFEIVIKEHRIEEGGEE